MAEIIEVESVTGLELSGTVRRRFVDVLSPRLVNLLTVLGFGLPVLGYFWLIHRYSVNDIYQDQWSDITVIQHSYSHLFDWGSLWSQHNENRIFFPNLIVVLLAHTTHFNIQAEEFLSGTMLVGATALFIWAHKRRSPTTPWLYYCPVVLLACSVVQYGAALWGFQMAWYLVLLALAATVVLIDRVHLTWLTLVAAIAAAVVGSFSSVQGLLIWPVGLVLLYHRRRRVPFAAIWLAAAAASAALYLYNFNTSAGTVFPASLTPHAISPPYFAIFAVGDVLGTPVKPGGHNNAILLLGLVIVLLALATIAIRGIRRDESSGCPVGIALICFGLLFAALVSRGRAPLGYWAAGSSGYTIYDVLIPIGIYLALLERPRLAQDKNHSNNGEAQPVGRSWEGSGVGAIAWMTHRGPRAILWMIIPIMALQIPLGIDNGVNGARVIHSAQLHAAYTARHIDRATDLEVLDNLNFAETAAFTRHQVQIAKELHLSLFSGD